MRETKIFFSLKEKYQNKYQVYTEKNYNSYMLNKSYNEVYFEMLPGCLAHDFDNSNYFNIENIYPFLDMNSLNLCFQLIIILKFKKEYKKFYSEKPQKNLCLLKQIEGSKKQDGTPNTFMVFQKKENILLDIINDKNSLIFDFLDLIQTKKLFKEHNKIISNNLNKENHMMFFWQFGFIRIMATRIKKKLKLYFINRYSKNLENKIIKKIIIYL